MYPIITIVFGHFPQAPGRVSFLLKRASAKPQGFFLFIYIFNNHKLVWGKRVRGLRKISHSLIHMDFIGLAGVRGLWKKGSERLKECLRVILSKNLESVACTLFISTLGLSSTPFVLYINPFCTFCAFLVKSGSFVSPFGGFFFIFFL